MLLLTGTDSHLLGTDTMVDLAQAFVGSKVPTVLGEVYDAGATAGAAPKRGATLQPLRASPTLSEAVTTVDDAELAQGTLAVVISLEQVADGIVGHYGYGAGASQPIPPIPS